MRMSFQRKLTILLAGIIIVVFSIMGIFMASSRISELRNEIVNSAEMFVMLSSDRIGDAFFRYYKNAFFKFRSIVMSHKELNRDLKNIQVVDLRGRIFYDMEQYEKGFFDTSRPKYTSDKFVLANVKKMEVNIHKDNNVCIIAPYIDEYGVHNYSIVYYFSLGRLNQELASVIVSSVAMALATVGLGIMLSVVIARRITGHLKILSAGAKRIAQGDFNLNIDIKTGDEIEDLARAFNFMSERIRENIRELNNLIEELKQRDLQKTQFLANISHELRTPLTASLGYVDYLEKGKMGSLNDDQRHGLGIIRRNLERLNREIHSLLLISKYTLEGVKLNPERFDITESIEAIIHDFTPEINRKGLFIEKQYKEKKVYADRNGIHTVVENLISNGIKFADFGTKITIRTDHISEGDKETFQFKISNHGPTIPLDQIEKIFEPFHQVDATTSRRHGGIGLGLSIARNIIEAHGGRIWAESKDGITNFYFSIPQRRDL
ncbi:MAG: HAMP domain-containing histidine kinase [candidate division WOR-3 bacterium]|nr:HAMP domain-containing histidine kinase [candidate division WOR-3 bacterium]